MDRDLREFLRRMDLMDDLVGSRFWADDEDFYWVYFAFDHSLDRRFNELDEVMVAQAWINRRQRKSRPTKRQLHPCRPRFYDRLIRREDSHNQAERLNAAGRIMARDLRDQLDDYYAEQVTDVPSVGLTVGNSYFHQNVGAYPLGYREPADYEDDWGIVEDDDEPAWFKAGFANEAEYAQYLDDVSWFYESSYDRDDVELETA